MQQDACQTDALRLPARKLVYERVALERHIDEFEFFLTDFAAGRAVDAVRRGKKLEIFDDLHVVVDAEGVGHVADQAADVLRMRVNRIAADIGLAIIGVEEGGKHAHGGGLARAVRANEPEHVALVEFQVDVIDGDQVAVPFGEFAGFDHGKTLHS